MNNDKASLLVTVARMYYEHNCNQSVIAEKLNISRPYVSKLLQEASASGIVKISIHDPLDHENSMEKRIRLDYGLQRVFTVPCLPNENTVNQVSLSAARYLNHIIKNNDIIGIANGTTMHNFALNIIPRDDLNHIRIVQLVGEYINMNHHIPTIENLKLAADRLSASPYGFPLPMFLENAEIKKAVFQDTNIQKTLQLQRESNIAIFSVGALGTVGTNSLLRSGFISQPYLDQIKHNGATGDILGHFIDVKGNLCDPDLDSRIVSLPLKELLSKEHRIGIAAGRAKLDILKSALAGHYMTALIIDEELGKGLILDT
mgnify:FL=1